jgi:hypothetical protein
MSRSGWVDPRVRVPRSPVAGSPPGDHSQRKTLVDTVTHTPAITRSAATSPTCGPQSGAIPRAPHQIQDRRADGLREASGGDDAGDDEPERQGAGGAEQHRAPKAHHAHGPNPGGRLAAGKHEEAQADYREHQLHDDLRTEDRDRRQRRRPQPLQDAAFAIDRDDRHERRHGAHRNEERGENRHVEWQPGPARPGPYARCARPEGATQ